MTNIATSNDKINVRQLCLFLAVLLPVPKLLEIPALLAYYAKGDLLFPAIFQYAVQTGVLLCFIFLAKKNSEPLFTRLEKKAGKWLAVTVYILLALFYLFSSMVPLFDLERFVYTAFFDTEPSLSAFIPFFIFSAFVGVKGFNSFGRICDLALPLFIISFVGLMVLSVGEADFSNLLPVFGTDLSDICTGAIRVFPGFSDTVFLLPLLGSYEYKKGDGKKIVFSYLLGGLFVLFFLAVFYGVFGALSPMQPFAFDKIARYFTGLDVIGRIDLFFVYIMSLLLLFFFTFPLQLSVRCFCTAFRRKNALPVSATVNFTLFVLITLLHGKYKFFYSLFTFKLVWLFPVFSVVLPLLLLLLNVKNQKEKTYVP